MPQETDRLKLPLPLGNETVNRESINEIFEKIDAGVATQSDLDTLREAVSQIDIPDASLTQKGKVQLSSKTDGTSETVAATEKAVRDARVTAETNAKNASLPRSGGSIVSDAGVLHLVGSTHVYQGFLPEGQDSGRKGYIGFGTPGGKDFTIANEYGGELLFRDKNGVTALSDLKQSVSNGKASIAAAITGKGVPTAVDAPFATMAGNINNIQQGNYQSINPEITSRAYTIPAGSSSLLVETVASIPANAKIIALVPNSNITTNLNLSFQGSNWNARAAYYLVDSSGLSVLIGESTLNFNSAYTVVTLYSVIIDAVEKVMSCEYQIFDGTSARRISSVSLANLNFSAPLSIVLRASNQDNQSRNLYYAWRHRIKSV